MAPESLYKSLQDVYKKHFDQKGHFVITQNIVEDVHLEDRQNEIIVKEDLRAHRGVTEVEAQLKRTYFFPRMQAKIKSYINTCNICNKHKYERKPYNIKISPRAVTEKPLERVHMDIIIIISFIKEIFSPRLVHLQLHMDIFIIDKCNFLSLIDSFTKHLQMVSIKTKNLIHLQKALGKYISTFGVPKAIITDHETTFLSIQLRSFLDKLGTQLMYAASSESNGQIERTHSTIIEIINTNKHKFKGMGTKSKIKLLVALYNDTVHSATKFTPNEITFNQNNIANPEEVLKNAQALFLKTKENILRSQQKLMKDNDNREDPPHLEEGQEVFVIPNIRTKTQPRANNTTVNETFKNKRNIKRHKNKIKRLKK